MEADEGIMGEGATPVQSTCWRTRSDGTWGMDGERKTLYG